MKATIAAVVAAVLFLGAQACGGDPCAEATKKFEAAAGKDAVAAGMKDPRFKRLFTDKTSCTETLDDKNKGFFDMNVKRIKELVDK